MPDPLRRRVLCATVLLPAFAHARSLPADAVAALPALERQVGGRLGVCALGDGVQLGHRADERFPMCSTFKTVLCGAVLARAAHEPQLLARRLRYTQAQVVSYSPRSGQHVAEGMTVAELCAAALQYSDNTAANVLMKLIGGPAAVTAFARGLGDPAFRLDRWETALNSALPGDERDTTTPAAMARTYQRLLVGDALPPAQRTQLRDWMLGNTTGASRIRAGVPPGWAVADKTGTGDYGSTNDAGILWPTPARPIALVVYYTQHAQAEARSDVIASVASIIAGAVSG